MTASLKTNLIEPITGTALTMGNTGQNVVVGADTIKANTLKDAGGNTLFTSDGSGTLSSVNAGFGSAWTLLSTGNASDSASLDFTLSGSYTEYYFQIINYRPDDQGEIPLKFQVSVTASAPYTYGVAATTSVVRTYSNEANNNTANDYTTGRDLQNSTSFQVFDGGSGNPTASSCDGYLHLYGAKTGQAKQFVMRSQTRQNYQAFYTFELDIGGYFRTTSVLTSIQFKPSAGDISTGTIKMYGIS